MRSIAPETTLFISCDYGIITSFVCPEKAENPCYRFSPAALIFKIHGPYG